MKTLQPAPLSISYHSHLQENVEKKQTEEGNLTVDIQEVRNTDLKITHTNAVSLLLEKVENGTSKLNINDLINSITESADSADRSASIVNSLYEIYSDSDLTKEFFNNFNKLSDADKTLILKKSAKIMIMANRNNINEIKTLFNLITENNQRENIFYHFGEELVTNSRESRNYFKDKMIVNVLAIPLDKKLKKEILKGFTERGLRDVNYYPALKLKNGLSNLIDFFDKLVINAKNADWDESAYLGFLIRTTCNKLVNRTIKTELLNYVLKQDVKVDKNNVVNLMTYAIDTDDKELVTLLLRQKISCNRDVPSLRKTDEEAKQKKSYSYTDYALHHNKTNALQAIQEHIKVA